MQLLDINSGNANSSPANFFSYNGKLFFSAGTASVGTELWITDGTVSGTTMVKDIYPGTNSSNPSSFYSYNDTLYFQASSVSPPYIWKTDGTSSGTQLFKNVSPTSFNQYVAGLPSTASYVTYNNQLYFTASQTPYGFEMFSSDGTAANTQLFKDINPTGNSTPSGYIEYNGKLFFSANDAVYGTELWVSDGTVAGTQMLKDIMIGSGGSAPAYFVLFNGKLYFLANDGSSGQELWVTDGTAAGTQLFGDLNPGPNSSSPANMIVVGNNLFFRANMATTSSPDYQLMRTDGTIAGTKIIAPPGNTIYNPLTSNNQLFRYDGDIYFTAYYDSKGNELWSAKEDTTLNVIFFKTGDAFSLYPNPNNGTFTLETTSDSKNSKVSVYDVMGRAVYQSQISNSKFQITLNQPNGIYVVKLQLDDAVMTKRMVVE
jgi:ELWxxDGT repeat protein